MLGAEGDTNLTNLVLSGDLTVGDDTTFTGDITVATTGTTSIGGGTAIDYITRDTFSWDSGLLAGGGATSTASFTWDATPLPAVGDACIVGNGSASSTIPEVYDFKITAANASTASGTLTHIAEGTAVDYGAATLSVTCFNY